MAEDTPIEWTDATLNPWIGCTKVSPACDHCYAEVSTAARALGVEWGTGKPRRRTSPRNWKLPVLWDRKPFAECSACGWRGERPKVLDNNGHNIGWGSHCPGCKRAGQTLVPARRRVFCASLGDWLDNEVPAELLADLLSLIASTPDLDWLLLTKRIGNWRNRIPLVIEYFEHRMAAGRGDNAGYALARNWLAGEPPANVWIGATISSQDEADRDVPKLLRVPAAVRFLSIEPMLGAIDLTDITTRFPNGSDHFSALYDPDDDCADTQAYIDWVIVGGESGPHARPMHPDWPRAIRDQCASAGVPFFFKQHGEWLATAFCDDAMAMLTSRRTVYVKPDGSFVGIGDSVDFFGGAEETAWVGKKAAGRLLDGIEHNGYPTKKLLVEAQEKQQEEADHGTT